MPWNWRILLKIVVAILRILQKLPPTIDQREISGHLADAIDNGNSEPDGGVE